MPVMKIQKRAVKMKTGLTRESGPSFQGSSDGGGDQTTGDQPQECQLDGHEDRDRLENDGAQPHGHTGDPLRPVVPKVEAATRLRRRPDVQPASAGIEYKRAWQAMAASTAVAASQPRLASPSTRAPAGSSSGTQMNSPAKAGPIVQTQLPAPAAGRQVGLEDGRQISHLADSR